jgi:proteasome accessory factor C
MTAIESFTRIQRALSILAAYPDGLPLDVLAEELAVPPESLRDEILQYYATDIDSRHLMGLQRKEVIDFVSADGSEADPALAPVLRLASDAPEAELGVQHLRADQLAGLYGAAASLAEVEPDNAALAAAVRRLGQSFLAGQEADAGPGETPAILRRAIDERRAVRIEYSREWRPGVGTRIVHPYALLRTGRGWELDAGPLEDGRARTFIVRRIRSVDLLDETFERPPGIEELLRRERAETTVELSLPQGSHWVADRLAERTHVLDSDAEDIALEAAFLPPVRERVALVLLTAGEGAFVVQPEEFVDAAADLAAVLRRHHGLDAEPGRQRAGTVPEK